MKIITFPIGTRSDKVKFGLTIVPALANLIAKSQEIPYTLALNTIDSYIDCRENYVKPYLKELDEQGIGYDDVWIDSGKEEFKKLLFNLDKLIKKGFITNQKRKVYKCRCGKVEFLDTGILNNKARLYKVIDNDTIQCRECGDTFSSEVVSCLIAKFPKVFPPKKVIPQNKTKEVEDTFLRISNMEYMVSRTRETGVEVEVNSKKFFIDVDFFWLNILNTFDDLEYLICGSNHVIWHLSMMCALKQVLSPNSETSMLLSPYIYKGDFNECELIDVHSEQAYIAFLGSLSWKKGNSVWNYQFLKCLKELGKKEYNYIINHVCKKLIKDNPENISKVNRNLILKLLKECK
ncbi:MAG TPA: hypothetical protein IAB27_06380 [Candidatus Coprosoma intestinipullorum]|uniref:Uncharacterized protein n=1 Tax=Candidatus Coprosoma intestinipullorum TaxID=2840752 RepID=A0A9D0ZTH7_9FIRM|nr:hypothetical protein [Candidatus Coprosoma intestinipullorum]